MELVCFEIPHGSQDLFFVSFLQIHLFRFGNVDLIFKCLIANPLFNAEPSCLQDLVYVIC